MSNCETIAFHLRPEEFEIKFPRLVEKMKEASLVFRSEIEFPNMGSVAILRSIAPDVVVTTDDVDPAYHRYLVSAKFAGIPTLLIQPGIISEHPFTWRNLGILPAVLPHIRRILDDYHKIWTTLGEMGVGLTHRIFHVLRDLFSRFTRSSGAWGLGQCTRIAVTGGCLRDLLISKGVPPEEIAITGQPRFDSILRLDVKDEFIRNLEAGKGDKKVALYLPDASSGHMMTSKDTYLAMTVETIKAFKRIPECVLVIKPHPDEDPSDYRSIAKELEYDAIVYEGSQLHGLIRASDIVITGISTTGFEALILEKTLVIISQRVGKTYLPRDFEYVPYLKAGVAYGIYEEKDFYPVLRKALSREEEVCHSTECKEFVYYHTFRQDGGASRRVAELLARMTLEAKSVIAQSPNLNEIVS
jgi:hypothetical protein